MRRSSAPATVPCEAPTDATPTVDLASLPDDAWDLVTAHLTHVFAPQHVADLGASCRRAHNLVQPVLVDLRAQHEQLALVVDACAPNFATSFSCIRRSFSKKLILNVSGAATLRGQPGVLGSLPS